MVQAFGLIYIVTARWFWGIKQIQYKSSLSLLQLSLRLGLTLPEKTTERDYELRSRGPATREFDALDSPHITSLSPP
jgi:hypothetical protein